MCRFAAGLVAMIASVSPVSVAADCATFAVTPTPALMDDRLSMLVSGLPPGRAITIRARSRARDGRWWRSEAVFTSRPDGAIDLGAQAPIGGTYRTADSMGLFWSMQPDAEPRQGDRAFFAFADWSVPVATEIEAVYENRVLGSVAIGRRFAARGVRCTAIGEDGVVGLLCEPGDKQRHPGVVILGGSEGGFSRADAAMLASRGLSALSLAYFGAKGVPPALQNIPLEYFGNAVRWMRARPGVDPDRIILFGASRGAEAALLAAAAYPEVKGVVAIAPAHAPWEGLNAKRMPAGPAWTYRGKALPYISNRIGLGFAVRYAWDRLAGNPVATTPLFLENLADDAAARGGEIPVEKIRGPVLLLSGKDDRVWPSSLMAGRVIARLRRNGHPFRDEHFSYEDAGHWLPGACVPMRGPRQQMKWAIGGTAEGTAKAQADSWPKILRFCQGG